MTTLLIIAAALLLLAIALGVFSYWGIATPAGRRQFDEMSGIYPYLAGLLATLFGLAGVVLLIIWRFKR